MNTGHNKHFIVFNDCTTNAIKRCHSLVNNESY